MNYNYYDYYRHSNKSMNDLFNPKEGFEKGNMFSNLYNEYKNYKPKQLIPRTEQEKRLYELDSISFAMHELNLYLDLHPEDQSMVTLFNDYRKKSEELTKEYESMYGPLTVSSKEMESNTFGWVNTNWPWEVDNV